MNTNFHIFYIFVHENDWDKIEDSINAHETLLKLIMVSPNKIKMVSNFNDEISMSDIFWREIMERKILWVPVVSCEKVYERIYVGMSMYRFISVSNVMCCMVFRQYNMKISGDLLMKIKIIIFKLIIIDLFIQGSFAARLIFLCFLSTATSMRWFETLCQGYEHWEKRKFDYYLVRGEIDI